MNNYLETRKIVDVIGTIYGSQEPGELYKIHAIQTEVPIDSVHYICICVVYL